MGSSPSTAFDHSSRQIPGTSGRDESASGQRCRRALVLAGGGAKGAYAFGCLRALREHGFQFDRVAGTSVGALNALIWSADQFEIGEEIWKGLSFRSIYPLRGKLRLLPPCLIWPIALFLVSAHLCWASIEGYRVPFRLFWATVVSVIGTALLACIVLRTCALDSWPRGFREWLPVILSLCFFLPIFGVLSLKASLLSKQQLLVGMLALFVLFLYVGPAGHWFIRLLGLFLGLVVYQVLQNPFPFHGTVLSQAGLRSHVEKLLAGKLNIPITAVSAWRARIFDPDNPEWQKAWELCGLRWTPDTRAQWIPQYNRVDKLDTAVAANLILSSAALPFGIVAPVKVGSRELVDGGIVDNVPVFPVLANSPDQVLIVVLEPQKNQATAVREYGLTPEQWRSRDRKLRLADQPTPSPYLQRWGWRPQRLSARHEPPPEVPFRDAPPIPELFVIAPTRRLGGFVTGTLNFDGKYAQTLIFEGYKDTTLSIKQGKFDRLLDRGKENREM